MSIPDAALANYAAKVNKSRSEQMHYMTKHGQAACGHKCLALMLTPVRSGVTCTKCRRSMAILKDWTRGRKR